MFNKSKTIIAKKRIGPEHNAAAIKDFTLPLFELSEKCEHLES